MTAIASLSRIRRNLSKSVFRKSTYYSPKKRPGFIYGVKIVESSEHEWEYAHDDFVRGQRERVKKLSAYYQGLVNKYNDEHVRPILESIPSSCTTTRQKLAWLSQSREDKNRKLLDEYLAKIKHRKFTRADV